MEEEEDGQLDDIPEEGSITMRIFSCCFKPPDKEIELNSERNIRTKSIYENDEALFPLNSIRNEEKGKITFTRMGLIEYIQNMQELVFPVLFEENDFKISKRNYTEINGNLPIFRFEITKHKIFFTNVPSIPNMLNAMMNPELRKKWDKNLKEYKIIEKMKYNDKRINIIDGGTYYLFSTSVPEINYLSVPNLDRGINDLCVMVVKEDDENFYFDCFNQIDVNINIPIEFIESNLVNKVRNFFDIFFEFLNLLK